MLRTVLLAIVGYAGFASGGFSDVVAVQHVPGIAELGIRLSAQGRPLLYARKRQGGVSLFDATHPGQTIFEAVIEGQSNVTAMSAGSSITGIATSDAAVSIYDTTTSHGPAQRIGEFPLSPDGPKGRKATAILVQGTRAYVTSISPKTSRGYLTTLWAAPPDELYATSEVMLRPTGQGTLHPIALEYIRGTLLILSSDGAVAALDAGRDSGTVSENIAEACPSTGWAGEPRLLSLGGGAEVFVRSCGNELAFFNITSFALSRRRGSGGVISKPADAGGAGDIPNATSPTAAAVGLPLQPFATVSLPGASRVTSLAYDSEGGAVIATSPEGVFATPGAGAGPAAFPVYIPVRGAAVHASAVSSGHIYLASAKALLCMHIAGIGGFFESHGEPSGENSTAVPAPHSSDTPASNGSQRLEGGGGDGSLDTTESDVETNSSSSTQATPPCKESVVAHQMPFLAAKALAGVQDMHIWDGLPEARFTCIPRWMEVLSPHIPLKPFPQAGAGMALRCCGGAAQGLCTFVVFFESCGGAADTFAALLQVGGWRPAGAGPAFKVAIYAKEHATAAYALQLRVGEEVSLPPLGGVAFPGVAFSRGLALCVGLAGEAACEAHSHCAWDPDSGCGLGQSAGVRGSRHGPACSAPRREQCAQGEVVHFASSAQGDSGMGSL